MTPSPADPLAAALAQAQACQKAGDLPAAEQHCRRALAADASSAAAHNLLGALLGQQGRIAEATAAIRRALELRPELAEAYYNLAAVALSQNQLDEAAACWRRVVRIEPGYVDAHYNLAVLALDQNRLEEAAACWQRVLQLQPGNAQAHNNLGVVLERQGNLLAASDSYRRATELKPDFAEAHHNLGTALQQQGRDDQAIACWRRAVQLKPTLVAAHQNLGKLLATQGRFDEARAALVQALAVQPDSAETLRNLAVVLASQGRFDEAAVHLQRVVELRPDRAESFQHLSTELARAGRLDEAIAVQRRATQLHPNDVEAHHILAVLLLLTGRLAEGWPEYEWRWKRPAAQEPLLPQPRWSGEPLAGRTLLLRGEQGLGDTLQFIRYARHVKQQGATVIAHVRPPLVRLVERMADVDQTISEDDALPPFDAHVAMMSLPGILGTTLETIPAPIPYVQPDAAAVAHWKAELASEPRYKVGIVWQGNPSQASDRDRSFPLAYFQHIARQSGIRLYSLQFGAGREQLTALGPQSSIVDLGDRLGDFLDTAAIMANLDLVITCDSAPAHLAGALGVNVWLPLPLVPDWRWLLGRDDTPWYPTLRLFRQTRYADWTDVFERMEQELAAVAKE